MKTFIMAGLLSFGLWIGLPKPVHASFIDGHTLYQWCSATQTDPLYLRYDSSCRTYILGVHDALDLAGNILTTANGGEETIRFLCVSDDVSPSRLRELVLAYSDKYPDEKEKAASTLVLAALYPEFPCQ